MDKLVDNDVKTDQSYTKVENNLCVTEIWLITQYFYKFGDLYQICFECLC